MGEATPLLLPPLLPPTFLPHFQLRMWQEAPRCLHLEELSSSLSLGMEWITWGDGELPGPGCGPMGLGTTWKEDVAGILVRVVP